MSRKPTPSYVVMATRDRQSNAERLAEQLDCPIVYDENRQGPWLNSKRCWQTTPEGSTHRVVVQDDARLCARFRDIVPLAIAAHPNEVIGLWSCDIDIQVAAANRAPFLWHNSYMSGLGLVMPAVQIDHYIKFRETYVRDDYTSSDAPLMAWLLSERRGVYFTVPSLLYHEDRFQSFWHREARNSSRKNTTMFADDLGVEPLLDPGYWTGKVRRGRIRPRKYISGFCPLLKEGVFWPPGKEPDQTYLEARGRPLMPYQTRRLSGNRDQWRPMGPVDPDQD